MGESRRAARAARAVADDRAEAVLAEVESKANPHLPAEHELAWEELIRHLTGFHGCDRAAQWMQAITAAAVARVGRELMEQREQLARLNLPPHALAERIEELNRTAQGSGIDTGEEFAAAGGWRELQRDHVEHHGAAWWTADHPVDGAGELGPRGAHLGDPVYVELHRELLDQEEE